MDEGTFETFTIRNNLLVSEKKCKSRTGAKLGLLRDCQNETAFVQLRLQCLATLLLSCLSQCSLCVFLRLEGTNLSPSE